MKYNKKKKDFILKSKNIPKGDQPKAIDFLVDKLQKGNRYSTLLGVTGSGKTFTMANVIARLNRPTLIVEPNKTLAAQLYEELKEVFPENSVSYFVSYYDYYQPEAYIPSTGTYIEKDASINEEIDRLRHMATSALLGRRDVIIIASVSCIYGLGSPKEYFDMSFLIKIGDNFGRDNLIKKMIELHYARGTELVRDALVVRGDLVEFIPPFETDYNYRIEFFDDEIDTISLIDTITGETKEKLSELLIYPASHFATSKNRLKQAIGTIREELRTYLPKLKQEMKLEEAKKIEDRTLYDLEMMEELGYCKGIENYSRHLTGRNIGEPPPTLLDYFDDDFLVFIDESHVTVPQIRGMYNGDRSRKQSLVEYGFRLPSALDNRPLRFEEFDSIVKQMVFVSATPSDYEFSVSGKNIAEQIIRPTGLLDPIIDIKPSQNQVENLLTEIKTIIKKKERVLVTTLTKKMAEDLTEYYAGLGIKIQYMHSDVPTLDRIKIINELRKGSFDVLVGINLLREGLDIPEVSLVAILDADKEGFLRSERALIQTIGRAARNSNGRVILYANKITKSIDAAQRETLRRRKIQEEYNNKNNIIPKTIQKKHGSLALYQELTEINLESPEDIVAEISRSEIMMTKYAREMNFEKAKEMRDRVNKLKVLKLELG